jgi:hypothetical protein
MKSKMNCYVDGNAGGLLPSFAPARSNGNVESEARVRRWRWHLPSFAASRRGSGSLTSQCIYHGAKLGQRVSGDCVVETCGKARL